MSDWRLRYSQNYHKYLCCAPWVFFYAYYYWMDQSPTVVTVTCLPPPPPDLVANCPAVTRRGLPDLQASRAIVYHHMHFISRNKIVHSHHKKTGTKLQSSRTCPIIPTIGYGLLWIPTPSSCLGLWPMNLYNNMKDHPKLLYHVFSASK